MSITVTTTSYWTPTLTGSDVQHLQSLGLCAATIKGSPYKSHLKRPGEIAALCGAAPGASKLQRQRRMVSRSGWYLYAAFESPGRDTCEACLRAAEELELPNTTTQERTS